MHTNYYLSFIFYNQSNIPQITSLKMSHMTEMTSLYLNFNHRCPYPPPPGVSTTIL